MTGAQFVWAFVIIWVGSGLAALAYFHYWMNKVYKTTDKISQNDALGFELIVAVIGGPINWLAIAVIIDTEEKTKDDDEDDMEV